MGFRLLGNQIFSSRELNLVLVKHQQPYTIVYQTLIHFFKGHWICKTGVRKKVNPSILLSSIKSLLLLSNELKFIKMPAYFPLSVNNCLRC